MEEGRLGQFAAGMASHHYTSSTRSQHQMGNDLSMREAQHMLTMPSDIFHPSIISGNGMPGWDTSRAGMSISLGA